MRTHTSHTQSHTQLGPGTARIFPKSFDSSFVFSLFAVSAACHVYFIPATQRGESRDSWLDSRLPKPPTSFYFPYLSPLPLFCWRHLLVALLPPGFFILFASCSFLFFCISSFFLARLQSAVCIAGSIGSGVFWLGFARICVGFSFQFLFQLSEMCIATTATTTTTGCLLCVCVFVP